MPRFRTGEKKSGPSEGKRLAALAGLFACCFAVLMTRAVFLHLKEDVNLQKVALRQYRTAVRESSKRGKILDSAGREMAIDISVESIFANPQEIENAVSTSKKLAQILKLDRSKLLDRLSTRRKFVWIKRRPRVEETLAVKKESIKGIYFMQENKRSYPNGTVGANLLGAVGYDSEPLGGVELEYDDLLSARSVMGNIKRDARGHLYLSPAGEQEPASPNNVVLTIDKTLQYIADKALAEGVASARAKGGEALVVDVRTGALLALSNTPTFDPNDYGDYPLSHWRNRAIVEAHEPGSTFKAVALAAALDSGLVKATDVFDCEGGSIRIGRDVISDSHPHKKLTVADILKVSSNIGAYKVVKVLGAESLYRTIQSFGFGGKLQIDLPGESAGLLTDASEWSPVQLATVAFGHGIAVTPLQTVMAFAAIANGGKVYKPHVVQRVLDEKGAEVMKYTPEIVSQPIGQETATLMTELLRRVVEKGGTGTLAASADYPVAGKTGTAQKIDSQTGRYSRRLYYASFVGFAPTDAPRIAVFVGIDEPRGYYYGGQVAAPVFREIVDGTLHYLKVPASLTVASRAASLEQLPPLGATDDLPIIEDLAEAERGMEQNDDGTWRLPDLSGLTMRGVLEAAGDADIDWRFRGTGIAVRQWPQPGSVVHAGERCMVEFQSMM